MIYVSAAESDICLGSTEGLRGFTLSKLKLFSFLLERSAKSKQNQLYDSVNSRAWSGSKFSGNRAVVFGLFRVASRIG